MKQISFKLQVFEGPLDLLLHLINKNKVNIYDIPISEITEQYIYYISEMETFDIEVSSEFLVLAANLLYIKSKMLLPKYDETEEQEDPRLELAQRLIEYKQFKQASQYLTEREFAGCHTFYKIRDYIEPRLIDESLTDICTAHLSLAMMQIYQKFQNRKPPTARNFTGIVGREIITVFSKVKFLISSLKTFRKIKFIDIFKGVKSRDEAVASFLAVLELMKMNRVKITDNKGSVELSYVNKKGMKVSVGDTED